MKNQEHAGQADLLHREYQLRYSELQPLMADEASRRQKARKIIALLRAALAPRCLGDLRLLDVGASTGIITGELGREFGEVVGIDIDEPGIARARRYLTGPNQTIMLADAMAMPFEDRSFDVVVANHVYEHMPDARQLFREIWRVLRPNGIVYFAADNRFAPIEPHYRLPGLSWLPPAGANLYLRLTRRGSSYYEQLRSYTLLRRLVYPFIVEDWTLEVIRDPQRFAASDVVAPGSLASRLPLQVYRAVYFFLPTYLFILRKPGGA